MTKDPKRLAPRELAAVDAIFDRNAIPQEVTVTSDRQHLRLDWPSGETLTLSAEDMRTFCRCAWCTKARRDGTFTEHFEDASISGLELVGDYAVNIAFADGHARGVFPWTYLRAIGSQNNEQGNGSSK